MPTTTEPTFISTPVQDVTVGARIRLPQMHASGWPVGCNADTVLTVTELRRNPDNDRSDYLHLTADGVDDWRWVWYHNGNVEVLSTLVPGEPMGRDAAIGAAGLGGVVRYVGGNGGENGPTFRVLDGDRLGMLEQLTGTFIGNVVSIASRVVDGWAVVEATGRTDGATPVEPTTIATVSTTDPALRLPRSAADATAQAAALRNVGRLIPDADTLAARLQDFARWLPGGELNGIAHEHAVTADLCGQYEAIVCPTFGWTPRNGEGSSMMRRCGDFFSALDDHERANASRSVLESLNLWMARYQPGGVANRAIVEHADAHLEDHKKADLNELLEGVLGWEGLETERDYVAYVDVTRTVTVTQRVAVRVTAACEEDVADQIDVSTLVDYIDDDNWTVSDTGDTVVLSGTSRYDIDDYDVDEVENA